MLTNADILNMTKSGLAEQTIILVIQGNSLTDKKKRLVDVTGIEPVTPCLQSRCSPS
jgi:hypothetical protein